MCNYVWFSMAGTKRDPPPILECVTEVKKFRSGGGSDEAAMTVTRSNSNNVQNPIADGKAPLCSTAETHSHSQHEKELRRERGEMLLRLYREHPLLIDTATARTMEKNQERAQLWEKITYQINDVFGSKLEVLSVEKTKKLLTYYKKKDDGSHEKLCGF
ncbi:unnamed protein product, partial [Strongylus vulgaris]